MKGRRSASRAELFTVGVCCFGAVRVSGMCFSKHKVQHSQTATWKLASSLWTCATREWDGVPGVKKKAQMRHPRFQNQSLGNDFICTFYLKSAHRDCHSLAGAHPQNSRITGNPRPTPVTQALLSPIFQMRKLKLGNVHPSADKQQQPKTWAHWFPCRRYF